MRTKLRIRLAFIPRSPPPTRDTERTSYATASATGLHADNNIVYEAEPGGTIIRFDATLGRFLCNDGPTQLAAPPRQPFRRPRPAAVRASPAECPETPVSEAQGR